MKWAAGGKVSACFLKRDITVDQIDDVDAMQQFLDERFGNHQRSKRKAKATGFVFCVNPLLHTSSIFHCGASATFTRLDTSVISARPASFGLRMAMTLPMSPGPDAPVSTIAKATAAATSSVESPAGI